MYDTHRNHGRDFDTNVALVVDLLLYCVTQDSEEGAGLRADEL